MAKCRGSGVILGGYRKEFEGETFKTKCVECWQVVEEVPIAPEPRTDLRKDGSVVWVVRKQIVDHEFDGVCRKRMRRDWTGYLFLVGFMGIVGNLLYWIWKGIEAWLML